MNAMVELHALLFEFDKVDQAKGAQDVMVDWSIVHACGSSTDRARRQGGNGWSMGMAPPA
ncbi:hypothetical protein [Novosphingobium guangzhouense]|uniref:hypothetical protein n=1 Tax=Novosphingobium guangzhouense TaxID=1850347 RepID=UPI001FE919F6|nr:hypothetical protein [Novosphingobium guangzhouense]